MKRQAHADPSSNSPLLFLRLLGILYRPSLLPLWVHLSVSSIENQTPRMPLAIRLPPLTMFPSPKSLLRWTMHNSRRLSHQHQIFPHWRSSRNQTSFPHRIKVSPFRSSSSSVSVSHNVFPDTITTDLLDSLGLIINIVHQTLICTTCGVSVDHDHLKPHFALPSHKFHNPKPATLGLLTDEIDRVYPPGLVFPPPTPESIVDAVYGLACPLLTCVQCSRCARWSTLR